MTVATSNTAAVKATKKKFRAEFWLKFKMSEWSLDELQFMKQHYQKTFAEIEKLIAQKQNQDLI
jgi:hypothetical protein